MLSISAMSPGQGSYYATLAREDYYLNGGEPPGIWIGDGADCLGLKGQVQNTDLLDLFEGHLGDRELVKGAQGGRHRPGWDLTFSAPKSVSVIWSQAGEATARQIQRAQFAAVKAAIRFLQSDAIWTRAGQGGRRYIRCGAVVACFEHGTSRAQDPQLHTHALLLNVGVTSDGPTRTIETRDLYRHKLAAGAIYRTELAFQLHKRLGFRPTPHSSWFEIEGVPRALIERFSTRRHEIRLALDKAGFGSSRAAEVAALETRAAKEALPREALKAMWRQTGRTHGFSVEEVTALARPHSAYREVSPLRTLDPASAVNRLMSRNSVFSKRDLIKTLAEAAQSLPCSAAVTLRAVRHHLARSPEVVPLGLRHRETLYSTRSMLCLEADLLKKASRCRQTAWTTPPQPVVEWVLSRRTSMNSEQRAALRHVTQESPSIALVCGMAGTGKTYLLEAVRATFDFCGVETVGTALSGKAAQGLEHSTQIPCSTIASLIGRLERGEKRLDAKTVLIVDEAAMVGTAQLHKLVTACGEAGAKLVLVGDHRQLQPIEAGGPFGALFALFGGATLENILRQREEWQRQAVKDLALGNSERALEEYATRGHVVVAPSVEAAKNQLLCAWKVEGIEAPKDNLVLTATNLDAFALNQEIQRLRTEAGFVSSTSFVNLSTEQIRLGDRILFTKNSKFLAVSNGTLGSVSAVTSSGHLTVKLDDGGTRMFSTRTYAELRLGYAFTTHKLQGETAKNVYILTNEGMQDRELSYVQASRVKDTARIFTTEFEAGERLARLAKTMSKSHQKHLATSLAQYPRSVPQMHGREDLAYDFIR